MLLKSWTTQDGKLNAIKKLLHTVCVRGTLSKSLATPLAQWLMLYIVCWKKLSLSNVYALSAWYTSKLCICKQCEEMVIITGIPLCVNFSTQNSSTPLHPQTETPPDGTPGTVRKRKRKRIRKTKLNRGEVLQMEYHSQVCMTVTCSHVSSL